MQEKKVWVFRGLLPSFRNSPFLCPVFAVVTGVLFKTSIYRASPSTTERCEMAVAYTRYNFLAVLLIKKVI